MKWIRQKETNTVWFHLYVESEKQNEETQQNKNRVVDTGNEQVVACRERGEAEGKK